MKTSEINKNDPEAYYPRYDPALHPKKERKRYHLKKRPDVYEKDPKAYYGPSARYQTVSSNLNDSKEVKIVMGDLSELIPSKEKIKELQRQLANLNNFIYLPKNMMLRDKGRFPYFNDPSAYYDPTKSDIIKKKRDLIQRIKNMKEGLRKMEQNKGDIPNPFRYEKVPEKITVENKTNFQVEEYNKNISNMLREEDSYASNQEKNKSSALSKENSKNNNINKPNLSTNPGVITFRTISSNY